jgi:uncharacterized protein with ParB-like and HNH nuclease domain
MNFFAKSYQLSTILQKKKYEIPEFQREYAWEDEQLVEFWEDLDDADNDLFLGTIVLAGDNFTDKIGPFEVIDGQQRLTTILLLLNRMINKFEELKDKKLAEALKNRLEFKDDDANVHLILDNKNAHSFFQKIVIHNQACTDDNVEVKNLQYAKRFFENKIKNYNSEELKKLRDHLLSINFIVVVQDNEEEAINIFETLNFRGINLNILDLVKSFVVRKYLKKTGIDDPREKWKKILDNIKRDKNNFFNRYWASHIKKISDAKLYKDFNEKTKGFSGDDVEGFLDSMLCFSDIYRDLLSPSDNEWEKYCPHDVKKAKKIMQLVISLNKFKVKVHTSFVISLLELSKDKRIHQDKVEEVLGMLNGFHFIFNAVCSKRPSGMDQKYSKYSVLLRKNSSAIDSIIGNLKKELREKLPEENEFWANFSELDYRRDKGLILYSFRFLEKKYSPGQDVDINEESLDHVSPQFKEEDLCHNVGNLILLEKELNSEKGDLELVDSQDIIKKTNYLSTKKFIKKYTKAWSESEIEERTKKISEEIYNYVLEKYF